MVHTLQSHLPSATCPTATRPAPRPPDSFYECVCVGGGLTGGKAAAGDVMMQASAVAVGLRRLGTSCQWASESARPHALEPEDRLHLPRPRSPPQQGRTFPYPPPRPYPPLRNYPATRSHTRTPHPYSALSPLTPTASSHPSRHLTRTASSPLTPSLHPLGLLSPLSLEMARRGAGGESEQGGQSGRERRHRGDWMAQRRHSGWMHHLVAEGEEERARRKGRGGGKGVEEEEREA